MNQTLSTIPVWLNDSHALSVLLVDSNSRRLGYNSLYKHQFIPSQAAINEDSFAWDSLPSQDVPVWLQTLRESQAQPGQICACLVNTHRLDKGFTHMQWLLMSLAPETAETRTLCLGFESVGVTDDHLILDANDAFLRSITDGMYFLDRAFRFTHINPAAEIFLGQNTATLRGKVLWEAFPVHSDNYDYPGSIVTAFIQQQTTEFEYYNLKINTWLKVISYPSPAGLVVLIRDITANKLAREKVRDSENKLRAILNTTLESNFLVGADHKILSFNQFSFDEVRHHLGVDLYEGLDIREFVLPSVMDTFLKDFQRALDGESLLNDILLDFPKGDRWYKIGFSPAYGNDGERIGVSFVAADIDDFKRNQLKLEEQYRQLREIADIQSHLVRRPLASILGLLSLIDPCHLDPETSEIIDLVQYATYELDTIIHEIVEKT